MSAIRAVVVDIEGTTTPISFVHEKLFPFAAERLRGFVQARGGEPEVAAALNEARAMAGRQDTSDTDIANVLLEWIAEDRKAGPLKFLQGLIWREGYEAGTLNGPVYPDAAEKMRAWAARGLRLFVYSSGSEDAQRLIFGYSDQGDLTPLFEGYFDTRIGAKVEAGSYTVIAASLRLPADEVLFLTDNPKEVDAALAAGMQCVRIDRDLALDYWEASGNAPVAGSFTPVDRELLK